MRYSVMSVWAVAALAACSSGNSAQYKPGEYNKAAKINARMMKDPITGAYYKVGTPYQISDTWYYPHENETHEEIGTASWYGGEFHNKLTGNGEVFDAGSMTAAHRTLPMPSIVRVTNLDNGKSVLVRVNDRGPFAKNRIIDVSEAAAEQLDFKNRGTARVRVSYDKHASNALFVDNGNYLADNKNWAKKAPVVTQYSNTQLAELKKPVVKNKTVRTMQLSSVTTGKQIYSGSSVQVGELSPVKLQTAMLDKQSLKKPEYKRSGLERPLDPKQKVMQADMLENSIMKQQGVASADKYSANDAELSGAIPQAGTSRPEIISNAAGHYVQVGSFSNFTNAQRAVGTLKSVGKVQMEQVSGTSTPYYRVKMGPFKDPASASAALNKLNKLGYRNALVLARN